MSTPFDLNDIDDEIPDFDETNTSPPRRDAAAAALGNEALAAALNRRSRAALKRHPSVFIVQIPHGDWAEIIASAVKRMDNAPIVKRITERKKGGGDHYRLGAEELAFLQDGRSVLYVTQDPDELLNEAVLAACDLMITIAPMSPELLRRVIRRVTGGVARGITAEMANLDLAIILSVVRPGLTASECVKNLRRAISRRPEQQSIILVPALSHLPLTDAVRKWSAPLLADLKGVKAGTVKPSSLLFSMLEGPPGTGKTLIAESLAKSAGWAFVPSSVGNWFTSGDGALGGVAKNLKSFVDEILANEPAVGFMDELDALPNRATMDNRGRDWWTPIINLFLTEIDRSKKSGRKVLLIGATNYYDRLDAALIRPGRLQQRVSVMPPETEAEVIALLRYYLGDELTAEDLGKLGRIGRGATPALVEGWVKEARSYARGKNRALKQTDILERMVPDDDRSAKDVRAIALHEIGHAIVAHRLGQPVETVSIIPDGSSGGRTTTRLTSIVPTWDRLLDMVTVSLGGRAADMILGDGPNAGAEGDLATATELLLAAFERQGLRGSLVFAPAAGSRSRENLKAVGEELYRLLERAIAIVADDRDAALGLADRLIDEKVLIGADVAAVLGPRPEKPGHSPKGSSSMEMRQPSQASDGGSRHVG